MATTINIRCANGHEQQLKIQKPDKRDEEALARNLAGLLDGSSLLYLYPPGEGSPIGKCGICQAQIKATVVTESSGKGVISDPDAVHKAGEQGFYGK